MFNKTYFDKKPFLRQEASYRKNSQSLSMSLWLSVLGPATGLRFVFFIFAVKKPP